MIRNRLKSIRHRLEIDTQTEMARVLGINNQQLSRWENQQGQPNLETAFKIWMALKPRLPDLHIEDLFEPPN